ncbi:phospho-N-acetylmuramoyl-pentapeptide-transferase [Papillibacter cinnamivorans]|uniref:Phospho-N-acetylmuramoyl-pentapeptide-transferase n=1 Tax=Papillibacter cinnamivorans DSM 12816 TaxID=1122930 RepID=A0A1W1Z0N4_9FIRM|nr:phospho-N-acetylmuramoyl-pentapeptide-transferase [Papillibacter cinnamivorans]SMC41518.1 Phospho-N-acetylmuramoyl-pentapeptide-transferase [Papillibacter cinnamivorans DSM 12816]
MRLTLSCALSFLITFFVGRALIPWLRRMKAGQSIREDGPKWHLTKQGTPTMGGIMFIVGIGAAVLIAGWKDLKSGSWSALFIYLMALVFGLIGYADDYEKVKNKRNLGLTALQKFSLQLAVALAFLTLMRLTGNLSSNLYIPFADVSVVLPWPLYLAFAAFVMVATVNAVNLTDGVDGLVTGVTIPVAVFFTAAAALWGFTDLGVFSAALLGGLAAFLIYNFHPAKVFMGDTGSLFLGGAVCGMLFAFDMPLIMLLVGIIYIAETLSDVIQVAYFKWSHGKRIFRMAPLHHHFEMGGWSEVKLFWVFSGITAAMCLLAYAGILSRYGR